MNTFKSVFLKESLIISGEIGSGFYGFLVNKHILFYRILKQNEIEVERILGAEMDLKKRLKE